MFYLKLAFTAAITVLSLAIMASASEFDRQCRKLLPEADRFYDRCQEEGVPPLEGPFILAAEREASMNLTACCLATVSKTRSS